MNTATRQQVVCLLKAGSSNRTIARQFGLTVNQVAGVRARTIGSTMSRSEALLLAHRCPRPPLSPSFRRPARLAGAVLRCLTSTALLMSTAELAAGTGFSADRVARCLAALVASGLVEKTGVTRGARYRVAGLATCAGAKAGTGSRAGAAMSTLAARFGWDVRENGEVWSDAGDRARPILYRVGDRWMVCGMRTVEELLTIGELLK